MLHDFAFLGVQHALPCRTIAGVMGHGWVSTTRWWFHRMPFGRNVTPQVLHRHPGHGAIIRSFSDGQHTAGSADLRGSVGATCGSSRQGFVRPGPARSSRCSRRRSPTCMAHGTRRSIMTFCIFGEPDGTLSARCQSFSEAMVAGGLKCPVERNLREDIWVKLMGNVAFDPLSALPRATMAEICARAGTRELVATMMAEAFEIAERTGSAADISIEKRIDGAAPGSATTRRRCCRTWKPARSSSSPPSSVRSLSWPTSPACRRPRCAVCMPRPT